MNDIFKRALMAGIFSCLLVISAQAETVNSFTFKDTDIKVVLAAITQLAKSEGADINIVPGPAVTGNVTVDLANVDWETALNVILRIYNLDAYRQKNVIMINPIGPAGSVSKNEIQVKVFNLNYIDANDALNAIAPILSSTGKTAVLETTGQSGWAFGSETPGSTQASTKAAATDKKLKRTSVLVVSDSAGRLEQISTLLDQLDVMPKQVLIKARILEVDYNFVKDLGLQWSTDKVTSKTAFTSLGSSPVPSTFSSGAVTKGLTPAPSLTTLAPATPGALTTGSALPLTPATVGSGGLQLAFQQLTGTQAQVILNALEEDTKTDTLSAPVLTTLNNQEATILVGEQFPITQTTVSSTTNNVVGGSLQYYQNIGIQLNVVPQVWGDKGEYINLIVHPVVSSSSQNIAISSGTSVLDQYPVINTQEAETQLVIPDNGTVMLGGLIKDAKTEQVIGIPVLDKLPFVGQFFRTTIHGKQKTELIIFITAHIMRPGEQVSPSVINTKSIEGHFTDKK